MTSARALALAMAAVAGVATVVGFAPFGIAHLPPLTLSLLFALWNGASSRRAAAETGFAFGLGLFGAGVSWVYIALETFGGMPAVIAIIATAAMVAYLALWPAIAGYLTVRFTPKQSVARVVAAAASAVLAIHSAQAGPNAATGSRGGASRLGDNTPKSGLGDLAV